MKEREWNDAIGEWFFGGSAAGRPVYLSVDDEVLGDIALAAGWDLDDPVSDFEGAVRALVARPPGSPFQIWSGAARDWSRRTGHRDFPPMLALLGASVLAGFRRSGGRNQGYHAQLQRILGLPLTGAEISDYRTDVPQLWAELARWLDAEDGRRGRPTARASDHWPYIGLSMSQALLRARDRSRLQDFFVHVGYEPRSEVAAAEVLSRFLRWAKIPGRVTPRLLETARHPEEGAVLGDLIASDLRAWDGTVRDERGRKVIRVDLQLDERARRVAYIATVPEGVPAHDVSIGGQVVSLPGGPVQARLDLDVGRLPLDHGWSAASAAATVRWEPQAVMVFRPNEDVGGWVSTRRGVLGEGHYVLSMDFASSVVDRFLAEHVPTGWAETKKIALPAGFRLFKHVVLEKSYADVAPVLAPLLPRAHHVPELVGGLRVSGRRQVYLREGAPDVLAPGWEDGEMPVTLDGEEIARVGRSGLLHPLASHGLASGRHDVQVGSTKLPFHLVDAEVDLPAEPLLVHGLDRIGDGFLPTGPVAPAGEVGGVALQISGAAIYTSDAALLSASVRARMVKPATRGYLVFGPIGCSKGVEVPQPPWAADLHLDFNAFEVEVIERKVGFPILWVVRLFQHHAAVVDVRAGAGEGPQPQSDLERWHADLATVRQVSRLEVPSGAAEAWERYATGAEA